MVAELFPEPFGSNHHLDVEDLPPQRKNVARPLSGAKIEVLHPFKGQQMNQRVCNNRIQNQTNTSK